MANPCEYSNKFLDFTRDGVFLERLSKKDCVPCRHFNSFTEPPVSFHENFFQHKNLISVA
jgi:hypothetical protein